MSIIIRQGVPVSAMCQIKMQQERRNKTSSKIQHKIQNEIQNKPERKQGGFTLPEILVSLCILTILMQGVGQWGIVMQRTADTMAQNQQAVLLAQQIYAGLEPQCPQGWQVQVESSADIGLLYETEVMIMSEKRRWQFYYAGEEEVLYAMQTEGT